ncbi:hypothetical protein SLS58_011083 [Diplodia intermedia]|uniref:Heterokaryon incompatibility domain-containing protein n=1 Tax=Diplodia intermedia TaxID=856260 RepID=A0ABR3T237_9PEZI
MPYVHESPHALYTENVDRIKECLTECSKAHHECHQFQEGANHAQSYTLPTRLLDLGKDKEKAKVRLIETSALGFVDLNKGPLNLPFGFRDTIKTCWAIGIRYLWIDSLCILQQDENDWKYESARMEDVYMGSFVTIILASTSSPLNGYLDRRVDFSGAARVSYHIEQKPGAELVYYIQPTFPEDRRDAERKIKEPFDYVERSIRSSEWGHRG